MPHGDVAERLTIRAPRDGRVVGLTINTLGQVVDPGQTILELMPADAGLLVETRVAVADIDEVADGQPGAGALTAYSFRSTPPVQGEVVMVAAGTTTDTRPPASPITRCISASMKPSWRRCPM